MLAAMTLASPATRRSKAMRFPPALVKGQLVRLSPDGPIYTVIRVSPCSAFVKAGDWTTEDGVLSCLENGIDSISLHSFVYPE